MTPTQLARVLARFEVRPRQVWVGGHNGRGYDAEDFADAWRRYLSSEAENGIRDVRRRRRTT